MKAVCLFIAIILARMERSSTRCLKFQVICEQTILSPQNVGKNRVRKNFELKFSSENFDSGQ